MNKIKYYLNLLLPLIEDEIKDKGKYTSTNKYLYQNIGIDPATLANVVTILRKNGFNVIREDGNITITKVKPKLKQDGSEKNINILKPNHPFARTRPI